MRKVLTLWCLFIGMVNLYAMQPATNTEILTITFSCPDTVRAGDTIVVEVDIDVHSKWHIYSPDQLNRQIGMEPFGIAFSDLPNWLVPIGISDFSKGIAYDGGSIYIGKGNRLIRKFRVSEAAPYGEAHLQGKFLYQGCDDKVCYPAMEQEFFHTLQVLGVADTSPDGADAAWEEVLKVQVLFEDETTYQDYTRLGPLEMKRFEDRQYQKKARLSLDFLERYPADPRTLNALLIYLSADPMFIDSIGNEDLAKVGGWKDIDSRAFLRSIKTDTLALKRWLSKGGEIVHTFLQESNVKDTIREKLSFALFARDFRYAASLHRNLDKLPNESFFWASFDKQYWQPFIDRFKDYARSNAGDVNIASRAQNFLSALNANSPSTAQRYWMELLQFSIQELYTGKEHGMKALRLVAQEKLLSEKAKIGELPLEISFTALDNRIVELKDLRGKLILLDFWASWCKPCLEEMPRLKELYDKYNKGGFEIIGICMDEEPKRDRVDEILLEMGVTWPQRFEGMGFQKDSLRLLYGINALPTMWLLDKDGMVIHQNARSSVLESLLEKHLVMKKHKGSYNN